MLSRSLQRSPFPLSFSASLLSVSTEEKEMGVGVSDDEMAWDNFGQALSSSLNFCHKLSTNCTPRTATELTIPKPFSIAPLATDGHELILEKLWLVLFGFPPSQPPETQRSRAAYLLGLRTYMRRGKDGGISPMCCQLTTTSVPPVCLFHHASTLFPALISATC